MVWLIALILLISKPCSAEEEWNGYRVEDVYYDEYTREPKGIVTGFIFKDGKVDGLKYNGEFYKEKVEENESTEKGYKQGYREGYREGFKAGFKVGRDLNLE